MYLCNNQEKTSAYVNITMYFAIRSINEKVPIFPVVSRLIKIIRISRLADQELIVLVSLVCSPSLLVVGFLLRQALLPSRLLEARVMFCRFARRRSVNHSIQLPFPINFRRGLLIIRTVVLNPRECFLAPVTLSRAPAPNGGKRARIHFARWIRA